jgi:hypothetical protein
LNHRNGAARLAGALLIVWLVAVACVRPGTGQSAQPAGSAPAAESSAITEATLSPDSSTETPGSSTDPVVEEIKSIDQLLKGIDGSLSGSEPGTSGGE